MVEWPAGLTSAGDQMKLPDSVQEIADVLGRERALFLIGQLPRCYAGKEGRKSSRVILYVPKRIQPDHPLVRILGYPDAQKLARAFGGEILQVANCAEIYRRFRDASIRQMAAARASVQAIAELMQVSKRHVQDVLRENPQEEIRMMVNDNNPGIALTG
jgi:hypothetical protein